MPGAQGPKTVKGAQSGPNYVSRLLLDCVLVFHKVITPAGGGAKIIVTPLTVYEHCLLLRPFNGLFSRTAWVSRYRKGKTSLDLNEARDAGVLGWQWHQLDHMQTICTSLQTDNHTNTSSLNFYRPLKKKT